MITILFSASTNGFYSPEVHSSPPGDAVPVTEELYRQLIADQAAGAEIRSDVSGNPVAWWPPAPTEAELLEQWRDAFFVSPFQAKAALFNRGKLDDAEAVAQGAGGLVLLAWQTASQFQRRSPAINALLPAIGITDPLDQDELFREAALITA